MFKQDCHVYVAAPKPSKNTQVVHFMAFEGPTYAINTK